MSLNLFQVLPDTFIQESLATRIIYENLDSLYKLDNEVRLSLLDLIRLRKLKFFHGIIYAFGNNSFGMLGTGNTDNRRIPTPIHFSNINGKRVVQASAGDNHSLILCEDGTVYSCGKNEYGRLGTGNTDDVSIPTEIDTSNIGNKRVIQVSAGGYHSLILCEDGTVYSFGRNRYGQLGNGNAVDIAIPTAIDTTNIRSKRVIQVAAGGLHSLILCEDGSVYSFGFGQFGQLGTGNTVDVAIPTEIDTSNIGDKRVIQVAAGEAHSLILCDDGSVYSCGYNDDGQLGNGTSGNMYIIATEIDTTNIGNKKVIQISAGNGNSLILCEDGSVYSFGENEDGQLGTGNTDSVLVPTEIDTTNISSKRVIQVSAGGYHSLLLCKDGTVYSFGSNSFGQLGIGNRIDVTIPTEIDTSLMDEQEVISISAGGAHSLILT